MNAIVQGCSRPPARSERCLVANGTPASAPGRALGYNTSTWERPPLIRRGSELSPGEPALEESSSQAMFPFLFSSRSPIQVRSIKPLSPCCTHGATTLFRHTSVTLVACSPVFLRSLMLYPTASNFGQIWSVQTAGGPRWSPPGNVEEDQGTKSDRRHRTGRED